MKSLFSTKFKRFTTLAVGLVLVVGAVFSTILLVSSNQNDRGAAVIPTDPERIFWMNQASQNHLSVNNGNALFTTAGVDVQVFRGLLDYLMDSANIVPTETGIEYKVNRLTNASPLTAANFSDTATRANNNTPSAITPGSINLNLFQQVGTTAAPDAHTQAANISRFTSREWQAVEMRGGYLTLWMTEAYRWAPWWVGPGPANYQNSNIAAAMRTDFNAVVTNFNYLTSAFPGANIFAAGGSNAHLHRNTSPMQNTTTHAHWNGLNQAALSNPSLGVVNPFVSVIHNPAIPTGDVLFLPSFDEVGLSAAQVTQVRNTGIHPHDVHPRVATVGHFTIPHIRTGQFVAPIWDGGVEGSTITNAVVGGAPNAVAQFARLRQPFNHIGGDSILDNRTGSWQVHPADRIFDRNPDIAPTGIYGIPLRSYNNVEIAVAGGGNQQYSRRILGFNQGSGLLSPYGLIARPLAPTHPDYNGGAGNNSANLGLRAAQYNTVVRPAVTISLNEIERLIRNHSQYTVNQDNVPATETWMGARFAGETGFLTPLAPNRNVAVVGGAAGVTINDVVLNRASFSTTLNFATGNDTHVITAISISGGAPIPLTNAATQAGTAGTVDFTLSRTVLNGSGISITLDGTANPERINVVAYVGHAAANPDLANVTRSFSASFVYAANIAPVDRLGNITVAGDTAPTFSGNLPGAAGATFLFATGNPSHIITTINIHDFTVTLSENYTQAHPRIATERELHFRIWFVDATKTSVIVEITNVLNINGAVVTATVAYNDLFATNVVITTPAGAITGGVLSLQIALGGIVPTPEQLIATVTFSDYTTETTENESGIVTWESSNDDVATVSATGLVTVIAIGVTQISARSACGRYTAVVTINVTSEATPIPDRMLTIYYLLSDRAPITVGGVYLTEQLNSIINFYLVYGGRHALVDLSTLASPQGRIFVGWRILYPDGFLSLNIINYVDLSHFASSNSIRLVEHWTDRPISINPVPQGNAAILFVTTIGEDIIMGPYPGVVVVLSALDHYGLPTLENHGTFLFAGWKMLDGQAITAAGINSTMFTAVNGNLLVLVANWDYSERESDSFNWAWIVIAGVATCSTVALGYVGYNATADQFRRRRKLRGI
ncbi:MAG: Ig-like domain-containing protein [Firmicutes bacterium]|nr:Ig-like domain-containing protein [Bacillota bacterium]